MTTLIYTHTLEPEHYREIPVDVSKYEMICKTTKYGFEKTPDDRPIKLYCDFDFKAKHAASLDGFYEECTEHLIQLTKQHINAEIERMGYKTTPQYAYKTATQINNHIVSFHLICINYKMTKIEQKVFWQNVERSIEADNESKWRNIMDAKPDKKFFDETVYSRGRFMRSAFCTKDGENRPFEIGEGTFEDTLISFDNHNAETLTVPIPEKPIKNTTYVASGKEAEEITAYLDAGMFKALAKEYKDWTEMGFAIYGACRKEGLPLFLRFSALCPDKYDEYNCREWYERLEPREGGRGLGSIKYLAKQENPEEYERISKLFERSSYNCDTEIFCKLKFAAIKAPETEKLKQLAKDLELAKLKEKKGDMKFLALKMKALQDSENYKLQKVYFEKFHFKCTSLNCYVRKAEDGYNMLSHEKIAKLHINLNGFIDMWLKDIYIREVETCDFNPPPMINKNNQFNLYTGMEYERLQKQHLTSEQIKLNSRIFIKHLWYLCGKNNAVLDYCLNYFAHMIQCPGELPRTSIVFKSVQGVGKSIFLEQFGTRVLGSKYLLSTTKIDDILGRFPQISQKFLVVMDETNPKDSFMANENIKSFITAPTLTYEKKGVDGIQIKNCGRMIFLTNNDYPVKIEQTDRRFVVVECSSEIKNNTVYFKALKKAFDDDISVLSFALFLKNRDISKFDPTNDRPITEIYKSIQTATIPMEQRFFSENTNLPYEEEQTGKDIFNIYSDWVRFHGKKPIAEQTFLTRLKNYEFIEKTRKDNKFQYSIHEKAHLQYIEKIERSLEVNEDEENEFPNIY